jgi:DNA gyrase/topoisomerase IV subunit B
MNKEKSKFMVLDDKSHVLSRPGMYVGATDQTEREAFLYNGEKFKYTSYECVPGLIKIINEIIDNAVDVAIRTKFKKCNEVSIIVNDKWIEVVDNGPGILVVPHDSDKRFLPELAWCQMRAGESFGEDRETIGSHGLGSVATNIFSKKFIGISDDGSKRMIITCKDNMSSINTDIIDSTSKGVTVKFWPDLERFGLDTINDVHINLIYQRLINLSISYPQIRFKFNKRVVKLNPKKFLELFGENFVSVTTDNYIIGVFPNEYDDFKAYSYVNGITISNGGNHVDTISNDIVQGLRTKLVRKHKSIKPGDIKNKLQFIVFLNNFKNPKFDSQTKERLTNNVTEIRDHLEGFDVAKLVNAIYKNEYLIDPIVEIFKLKEEYKDRQKLKNLTKTKTKIKSDKYISPSKENKYIFLTEGLSASSGLSAVLGRENIGYYAMRGVPLNAYDTNIQKIVANQEIKDISSILSLNMHDVEMEDSPNWYEIEIDDKKFTVNENDKVFYNEIEYDIKELLKEIKY